MAIDFGKAWKIIAKLRKYPELHDQNSWVNGYIAKVAADNSDRFECGTTACFAGWGAFLFALSGSQIRIGQVRQPGKMMIHVSDFTQEELGLSHSQANTIFYHCQDVDEIEILVEALEADQNLDGQELWNILIEYRKHEEEK